MNKIDFVVTWVDGNDSQWKKEKESWEKKENRSDKLFTNWINSDIRYRNWDIFKYWFRGVEKYAPWVNNIYIITYGHIPDWLNIDNPKIHVVKHSDIIPNDCLPTYNTNAIELNMHKIEGLSECFVYFNDDMFITKKVNESDFFINEKPVMLAALDNINFDLYLTHPEINNMKVINNYFNKKEVIKKNIFKWFNLKYGRYLIKTILLLPWKKFTGIQETHIAIPYKKEYFQMVWDAEYNILNNTIHNRFRSDRDVSNWLIENWQIVSGDFVPRSSRFGKHFEKEIDDEILNAIIQQKYKCICINDVECDENSFIIQKELLQKAFQKALPNKSSFEK